MAPHDEENDIVGHVAAWAGGEDAARSWYAGQPLPSFGGVTAAELVERGRAGAVWRYLERIGAGGYA